jgi:arginine decarboxylase
LRNISDVRDDAMKGSKKLTQERLQEIYNDVVYYRDKLLSEFGSGDVTLRQRAAGEEIYWQVLSWLSDRTKALDVDLTDMSRLTNIMTDYYYANFSVFQSLPDLWAIGQIFPVMPIHKLTTKPDRQVVLSDITCDSDGKINKFAYDSELHHSLPLHDVDVEKGEDYMLGVFLVGAYQETLGDLHNLLGDTNVVSVSLDSNGRVKYHNELDGDTVAEVLSYVEYDPKNVLNRFRKLAESAVSKKIITASERREIVSAFDNGLRGYTYFET